MLTFFGEIKKKGRKVSGAHSRSAQRHQEKFHSGKVSAQALVTPVLKVSQNTCPECHELELVGEDRSEHWSVCRHCGARTAEVVRQHRIRLEGVRYIRTELRCHNCGESDHRDHRDNSTDDAALGTMLLGGLLSGGRHRGGGFGGGGFGGGFGGGSFGGGSSGGGGATSGW